MFFKKNRLFIVKFEQIQQIIKRYSNIFAMLFKKPS